MKSSLKKSISVLLLLSFFSFAFCGEREDLVDRLEITNNQLVLTEDALEESVRENEELQVINQNLQDEVDKLKQQRTTVVCCGIAVTAVALVGGFFLGWSINGR